MNSTPETFSTSTAPVKCPQVLDELLQSWPEVPSDTSSSALLDHLCHCRGCFRKWIAFEAAAELAIFSTVPRCN
jgi:hypothetical protein